MWSSLFLYDFIWLQLLFVLCCILLITSFAVFSVLILFLISIFLLCCCFTYINLWPIVILFLFIEIHLIYMITCLTLTWLSYENNSVLVLMRSNILNIFLILIVVLIGGILILVCNLKLFISININLFPFFCYDSFINIYIVQNISSIFQIVYLVFFYILSFDFCTINILLLLAVLIISSISLFIQVIHQYLINKNFFFFSQLKILPVALFSRKQEMSAQLRKNPITRAYTAVRGLSWQKISGRCGY